ncbi:MAG: hypothetical protein V1716_03785 [Candidatus Uhrbacteria bacterium]
MPDNEKESPPDLAVVETPGSPEPPKETTETPRSEEEQKMDREARINEEMRKEQQLQTKRHFEGKAKEWPATFEKHKTLLQEMLTKVQSKELTSGRQVDEFLANPPLGEGIEDPDARAIIMETLEKIQPIADMPQALETLIKVASGEGVQLKVNQLSSDLSWFTDTPEGQVANAEIRAGVEARLSLK